MDKSCVVMTLFLKTFLMHRISVGRSLWKQHKVSPNVNVSLATSSCYFRLYAVHLHCPGVEGRCLLFMFFNYLNLYFFTHSVDLVLTTVAWSRWSYMCFMSQELEIPRSRRVGLRSKSRSSVTISIQIYSNSLGPVFYPPPVFQQLLGPFQVKAI